MTVDFSDWTWLLKVPVTDGRPTPMHFWFYFHAYTLKHLNHAPEVTSLAA